MRPERRRAGRIPINASVIFRTDKGQEGDGEALNLSTTGMLLSSQASLCPSTEVFLYFKLAERAFIAEAEVVRTVDNKIALVFRQEPYGLRGCIEPE